MYDTKKKQITQLNDQFRKEDWSLGTISFSPKVEALPEPEKKQILSALKKVDSYIEHPNVDSVEWHDFGLVTVDETDYFWEIDYFDQQKNQNSPTLADTNGSMRTLTIVRTDEY